MDDLSILGGMSWPDLLLTLVLWGAAIALVLWGVSGLFPAGRETTEADALAILEERYARGEISREAFREASEALRQPASERPGRFTSRR